MRFLTQAAIERHNWDLTDPRNGTEIGLVSYHISQQIKNECKNFAGLWRKNVKAYLKRTYKNGVSPQSKQMLLRIRATQVCYGYCVCSACRYLPGQL